MVTGKKCLVGKLLPRAFFYIFGTVPTFRTFSYKLYSKGYSSFRVPTRKVLAPLDQLAYLHLITGYFIPLLGTVVPRPGPSSLVPDPHPSSRTVLPRPSTHFGIFTINVRWMFWTRTLLYACRPYVYLFITQLSMSKDVLIQWTTGQCRNKDSSSCQELSSTL